MRFANPEMFLLFFLLFSVLLLQRDKRRKKSFIYFTRGVFFENQKTPLKAILLKLLKFLKYAALSLIIIAVARPQKGTVFDESNMSGIDIMIAMDISSSMRSLDFHPLNRLEAAKNTAADFIKGRISDRIGLVVFSGLAFTQCPLTTDRESLLSFVKTINIGDIDVDGTAIGSALITALNRLKESKSKEKVIILITDGNNNMGEVDPLTAAKIAAGYGIKIYAVGVGSLNGAVFEVDDPLFGKRMVQDNRASLNEEPLKDIAAITSGQYFRATDTASFKNIMKKIDALEKEDIKVKKFVSYKEIYKNFALAALILLFMIMLLENTYLRKLP